VNLDTSRCYRLTNALLGEGQSLDLHSEIEGELDIAETEDRPGQYWRLFPLEDGKYAIRNEQLGDGYSLDVVNDGVNDFLSMTEAEDASGQAWTLTPWGDGTWRLTNECTGPDRCLDIRDDTQEPCFAAGDRPGMHWSLTAVDEPAEDSPEPEAAPEKPASRWANKVPTMFFVAWGIVCLAALLFGPWALWSGLAFREGHQQAEATVVMGPKGSGRKGKPAPHLEYEVAGKRYTVAAPPEPFAGKQRKQYLEKYQAGKRITVWYPNDKPEAANIEGDSGALLGGIVFTGVGVFFSLIGVLVWVAEFRPNRYIRFGEA
jgi:hypothetical protein